MPWGDVGVPAEAHVRDLLYCSPAEMMVLHAQVEHRLGLSRLYGKQLTADRYEDLVPASADETLEHPVVCGLTPSLYYMVQLKELVRGKRPIVKDGSRVWEDDEKDTVSGWIKGVYRMDLAGRIVTPLVEYRVREERDEWISRLHGVAPDGHGLFCSAARLQSSSDAGDRTYAYSLCCLDVATGTLTTLAPLRSVFF